MIVDLRIHALVYSGLYSDVFEIGPRICKLFKRRGDPNLDSHAERLFEAQCEANVRAGHDPQLCVHIPKFFGVRHVSVVFHETGLEIGQRYNLHSCYVLQKLSGLEKKVTDPEILELCPHVRAVRQRFASYDIDTSDSSVFSYYYPARFQLIDFTSTRNQERR